MRPVGVVMVDEVDDEAYELVSVPDDGAIEQFPAQGADPKRSANAFATGERTGVLRILRPSVRKISSKVPVNWLPRSRTSAPASVSRAAQEQVSCRLDGPGAGRVGGDPGEEDFAGGHVDEEQQVVAA